MGDDREALARLIDPTFDSLSVTGTPYWQRILATADRILAAGWCRPPEPQGFFDAAGRITAAGLARIEGMPDIDVHGSPPEDEPPEPQAADLPLLDAEARPVRFRLRVTETPPPLPIAEPQAAASEVVGTQFALKLANSLVEAADAGVSVNPAELAVARVLLAEHARAEAAERERDFERKRANSAEAENLQMMRRNTAMHNAKEAAEAAVKRLEDAIRWVGPLLSERNFKKLCAALTPAGGGDGR